MLPVVRCGTHCCTGHIGRCDSTRPDRVSVTSLAHSNSIARSLFVVVLCVGRYPPVSRHILVAVALQIGHASTCSCTCSERQRERERVEARALPPFIHSTDHLIFVDATPCFNASCHNHCPHMQLPVGKFREPTRSHELYMLRDPGRVRRSRDVLRRFICSRATMDRCRAHMCAKPVLPHPGRY